MPYFVHAVPERGFYRSGRYFPSEPPVRLEDDEMTEAIKAEPLLIVQEIGEAEPAPPEIKTLESGAEVVVPLAEETVPPDAARPLEGQWQGRDTSPAEVLADLSKAELLERAKAAGLEGLSGKNKAELVAALQEPRE